jgi:two-component system cell cycle sensor histidine kinase/response regulator CckA
VQSAIFVLDDEQAILNLARLTLEDAGYKVYGAGNGKEAGETCKLYCAECSAGVFDIEVPGMTVATLDTFVQTHFPQKGIVFMSGYPEDSIADFSAETLQWYEFLKKPFFPQDLLGSVQRAVSRTFDSGNLARNA